MVTRYYSPNDPENYVTPSRLKRLGKSKQIAYIAHWFRGMFEDPQNQTPYALDDESPHNYEYIWGGPYEANDEISDEFGGVVSDEVIEAAVKEVERNGIYEWAPSDNHPDYIRRMMNASDEYEETPPPATSLDEIRQRLERGIQPNFGDPLEREERQELREDIARLRELLEERAAQYGGIGHNNPPDEMRLDVNMTVELTVDVGVLDSELAKPAPDLPEVVEKVGRMQRLMAWGAGKLELTFDAFMKRLGDLAAVGVVGAVGGVIALGSWQALWIKIMNVVETALQWLNTVTLPF